MSRSFKTIALFATVAFMAACVREPDPEEFVVVPEPISTEPTHNSKLN